MEWIGRSRYAGSRRGIILPIVATAAVFPPAIAAQTISMDSGAVRFSNPSVVPSSGGVENWIDASMLADGGLVVADMYAGQLLRLGAAGNELWTVGGLGDGPGEFARLYRVAEAPNGEILALDLSRNDVSVFSPEGVFISRTPLGFSMRQIDTMLKPSDDRLILSGIVRPGREGEGFGIHVLDENLEHVESFGPVPTAKNPEVLSYWGAGMLRYSLAGDLIYTLRLPYQIYTFSPTGELKDDFSVDVATTGSPDAQFEISRTPAFSIQHTDELVTIPVATVQITEDLFLGGRVERDKRYLTLFDATGRVIEDRLMEPGGPLVFYADPARSIAWMSASIQLEPKIMRAELIVR